MPTGIYERSISTERELFDARVVRSDGCWEWSGSHSKGGYAVVTIGGRSGRKVYGHRVSYQLFVGEIPEGLEIDHLCRNRGCVNPEHLEAVTRQVNTLRGVGPEKLGAINGDKTHCKWGHPFDEENTRIRPTGGRSCRICDKARCRGQHPSEYTPEGYRRAQD